MKIISDMTKDTSVTTKIEKTGDQIFKYKTDDKGYFFFD